MKKQLMLVSLLSLMGCFLLTGCGKDQALDEYKTNMTAFCENVTTQNETINAIDPVSENATEELLRSLDTLEEEFTMLADMPVPNQFSAVESLADEAANYMTEAVSLYHEAFSAAEYDDGLLTAALESYQRAIKRVQYIGDILMGHIPEGEDIKVHYSDEADTEASAQSEAGTDVE